MSKVIIHLRNPIFGGGVLTDREVQHEKIFSEEVHGKGYKETAKIWCNTHANNVARVDGLDKESEEQISTARRRKAAEGK